MAGTPVARHSRQDLLREGLALLAEGGIDGLTIDALCSRLKVTKGSFYHHFGGRQDFLRSLLEHWADQWTRARMVEADKGTTPRQRFENIMRESSALPSETETSIRAWAARDSMANAFQAQVDRQRIQYLESIFLDVTGDTARSRLLARIDYSLFVGARAIAPPFDNEERLAMFDMLSKELYRFPA